MFSLRNKKNDLCIILNTPSYLELCNLRCSLIKVYTICSGSLFLIMYNHCDTYIVGQKGTKLSSTHHFLMYIFL